MSRYQQIIRFRCWSRLRSGSGILSGIFTIAWYKAIVTVAGCPHRAFLVLIIITQQTLSNTSVATPTRHSASTGVIPTPLQLCSYVKLRQFRLCLLTASRIRSSTRTLHNADSLGLVLTRICIRIMLAPALASSNRIIVGQYERQIIFAERHCSLSNGNAIERDVFRQL